MLFLAFSVRNKPLLYRNIQPSMIYDSVLPSSPPLDTTPNPSYSNLSSTGNNVGLRVNVAARAVPNRRDARAVESGGLENRCALMGTGGSNPPLSAKSFMLPNNRHKDLQYQEVRDRGFETKRSCYKAKARALTYKSGAWTRRGTRRRPVRSKQDVCDWKANPPLSVRYLER
jgi:hypothetical protein